MPHLSLVVPVHNGAERLPASLEAIAQYFAAQSYAWEVVLVDDGSDAVTRGILEAWVSCHPGFTLLRNQVNRGKGHAVARGMLAATGAFRVFTDADLAYPMEEVGNTLRALEAGSDAVVACRVLPESRYLISPSFFNYLYTRHLASRAFNLMIRAILLPGILDTQAGLKGFTAGAAGLLFSRLTVAGFGFDVELLFVARRHGLKVTQRPVTFRYDSEPTTVRFIADAFDMAADLALIRWRDWWGRYR
ncbi:MAG TPA: glycosyltransferase [Gemmatimonadales bacterium]|nr:glycosyltransferase [Gemmatimonadales bacterium]